MIKAPQYFLLIFLTIFSNSLFSQSNVGETFETKEFKVLFPGPIQKTTQTIASSIGDLIMTTISYEPADSAKDQNYVYSVIETNYPDSIINSNKIDLLDTFFRGAIDGAVKNVNGTLISETTGNIGQYPSRSIEIDYGNGMAIIKSLIILRENKLIMLQTITDTNTYPNDSLDYFFSSLKLK